MIDTVPIVREATPADVEQLAPLFVHSVDTSIPGVIFSADPSYAPERVVPHLHVRLFPPKAIKTFVLELHTGELAGYASVKPGTDSEDEIDMFFVRADLNGRGYGGQLMQAAQKESRSRGRGLHLLVFKKNTGAIRFYEKWGFRLVEGQERVMDLSLSEPAKETACLMRWATIE